MKAIIIGAIGVFLSLCFIIEGEWWAFFTLIISGMVIGGGMGSLEKKN